MCLLGPNLHVIILRLRNQQSADPQRTGLRRLTVQLPCLPHGGVVSSARGYGAPFFKMSSLEQRLSRIEEKLKQENEEARRRIDLSIDMSPQRSRPRPSECPPGTTDVSVSARSRRETREEERRLFRCL